MVGDYRPVALATGVSVGSLKQLFLDETPVNAVRRGLRMAASGYVGRLNARTQGWIESRLPVGSRIVGGRHIEVGPGFFASGPVWIEAVSSYEGQTFSPKITIGSDFRASPGLHITSLNEISIGNDCLTGSHVLISDNSHGDYRSNDFDPDQAPSRRNLASSGPVHIGDRCWLGDNVVVLAGVEIGSGCVVGANSVVTKSIQANSMVAGAPARVISVLDAKSGRWTSVSA